jgi:hypothetical protein
MDAERAFVRANRARRRAALARVLRGRPAECGRLAVHDERTARRRGGAVGAGIREIPVDAIVGSLEPARARLFDERFRPKPAARPRWERLWLAEHRGRVLPPVSVVPVGQQYALRDGHHRVSIARARGATTIDAVVDAPLTA